MSGIAGAQEYAERLDKDLCCDVCGEEFPLRRGSRVGMFAKAVRGVGVVEICSEDCLDKLERSEV